MRGAKGCTALALFALEMGAVDIQAGSGVLMLPVTSAVWPSVVGIWAEMPKLNWLPAQLESRATLRRRRDSFIGSRFKVEGFRVNANELQS